MTVADIKERLREIIDEHAEDEFGRVRLVDLLVEKLYALEREIGRALLMETK